MDTQLLDAIRVIMREELKPVYKRFDDIDDQFHNIDGRFHNIDDKFKSIDYKFKRQDDKLDAILEAWEIQKAHRLELNDHEDRIQAIEHRIPAIS